MAYTSYSNINTLDEFSFIAGSTFYLDFQIYDENGQLINTTGKTMEWRMSPYGQKDYNVLTKTQTSGITNLPDGFTKRVTLNSSDTLSLGGKYIHQIIISETISGNTLTYKPAQGVITIVTGIAPKV